MAKINKDRCIIRGASIIQMHNLKNNKINLLFLLKRPFMKPYNRTSSSPSSSSPRDSPIRINWYFYSSSFIFLVSWVVHIIPRVQDNIPVLNSFSQAVINWITHIIIDFNCNRNWLIQTTSLGMTKLDRLQ